MAGPHFTLVVNSCDAFEDTWVPFFTLLRNHASGLETDGIVLVTERKDYAFDGLNLRCSRANREHEGYRMASDCLLDALDAVKTPLMMYMQDDYFIDSPVNVALINQLAEKMAVDPGIGHIGLTHFGSHGPFTPADDPRLKAIGPRAKYRISTQAGLWRVDTLRSYLRAEENAWMFEIYGTRRSWKRNDLFLTVDPASPAPISYTHTGIIKGRWHRAMPKLFARHEIPMDFERRGFYDPPPTVVRKWRTFRTLLSRPKDLWRGLRGE